MRLLIDARGLLENNWAGVEGYTVKMLEGLKRMYPDDEYILFSYSRSKEPSQQWMEKYDWRHFRWSNAAMSWWWWGVCRWPKVDNLVKKLDLVWCPNIRFLPTTDKVKRIVTVHDLSFEIMPECYSLKRRLWHQHMRIAENLRRSAGIVAVSEKTAQDLEKIYQIDPAKIKVIYSGIEKNRQVIDTRAKDNYILCLGTLEPRKNIEFLLKSYELWLQKNKNNWEKIPDLWLMGGNGDSNKDLDRMITGKKWRNKIKYLGYSSEKEKNTILAGAKMLLYLSYYEGFGFPPLEAMNTSVPVIASHGGSIGEVLGQGVLIVNPFDMTTLVNVMERLLSDEKFRYAKIDQGKKIAGFFGWERTVREFREWAGEVVG